MNKVRNKISKSQSHGWRTYGTRAHNRTRNSMLTKFVYFFTQTVSLYCEEYVYIGLHIPDCAESVYELPLLQNNTASEIFFTQIGSDEKCWEDIYRWGVGVAVTG